MKNFKLLKIFVGVALIAGSAPTLASSGARMNEMKVIIEASVSYTRDRNELLKGVARYMDRRDATLQRLSGLIKNESSDKQRDTWISEANSIQDAPELKMTLVTDEARETFVKLQGEEIRWIAKLIAMPTASSRDQILALQAGLKAQTEKLQKEWNDELGTDDAIDNQETVVMGELQKILAKVIDDVTQTSENINKGYKYAAGALLGLIPVIGGAINIGVEKLIEAKNSAQERKKTLLSLIASEKGGALVRFRESRLATEKFIQENGFDQIKAFYGTALNDLGGFTGFGTSGQQADAKSWGEDITSSLSKHVATSQDVFNTFVVQNKGKFFGPLSPEISEQLLETRTWGDRRSSFGQLDLDRKLRDFNDKANSFFEISSSGLTDDDKKVFMEKLTPDIKKLISATEDLKGVVAADTMLELFDRRILEDALR